MSGATVVAVSSPPPIPPRPARVARIVDEARALLRSGGWEAVTARALADRLGVRAPSLYKHVSGLDEVRVALLVDALVEMGEALHRSTANAGTPVALAQAYRRNALADPHTYRLATSGKLPRRHLPEGLEDWAGAPFGLVTGQDPVRAQAFWAWCHGMAILEIEGRFLPQSPLDDTWAVGAAAFGD